MSQIKHIDAYARDDHLIIKGLHENAYAERVMLLGDSSDPQAQMESHLTIETTVATICNSRYVFYVYYPNWRAAISKLEGG